MGLENSDELGEVTNYAHRWKLYHKSSYTSCHTKSYAYCSYLQ